MVYFSWHKCVEYSYAAEAIANWLAHNAPNAIFDREEVTETHIHRFYHARD